jgi:hypothetical protein
MVGDGSPLPSLSSVSEGKNCLAIALDWLIARLIAVGLEKGVLRSAAHRLDGSAF